MYFSGLRTQINDEQAKALSSALNGSVLKLKPRPNWCPLGVDSDFNHEHPEPFHTGIPVFGEVGGGGGGEEKMTCLRLETK